jgi:hypothetical protein
MVEWRGGPVGAHPRVGDYTPERRNRLKASPNWSRHTEVRQSRVNPTRRVRALHERQFLKLYSGSRAVGENAVSGDSVERDGVAESY